MSRSQVLGVDLEAKRAALQKRAMATSDDEDEDENSVDDHIGRELDRHLAAVGRAGDGIILEYVMSLATRAVSAYVVCLV